MQSISRSAGLPNTYGLGLIKSDAIPLSPTPEIKKEMESQKLEKPQQIASLPLNITIQDEEAKESRPSNQSGFETVRVVSPPIGNPINNIQSTTNKPK